MKKHLAMALALALAGHGAVAADQRTLSVTASGTVDAVPDMARLSVGVSARAQTAKAATAATAERARAVLAALDTAGIAAADRQTLQIGLVPVYARDDRGRPLRVEGYEARQDLSVVVRDLAALGPLMDALVEAGAGTLGGVAFDVADRDALLDEARRRAVTEARRIATLLAEAASAVLGPVQSLNMGETYMPPGPVMRANMAADAAPPMPVAEGTLAVTATVSASFLLE